MRTESYQLNRNGIENTLVSSSNSIGKCSFVSHMRSESWKLHEKNTGDSFEDSKLG